MSETVKKALALWGMEDARWRLIAARENRVFRIDTSDQTFAMRLHRQEYRSDSELRSELQLLDAVAKGGLHVPAPIQSKSGYHLHTVDDTQIDVLSWLTGEPMGKSRQALEASDRHHLFYSIGSEMARLHGISDAWHLPDGFTRCSWDRDGLLGETPVWGRFWDNPCLSEKDRAFFTEAREYAREQLINLEDTLDYGLIHADLVRENIMLDGNKMQLIDFDDSGFGFRLFDLATTLLANLHETDYADLKESLIAGYKSQREINTDALDLFMLLRATSYVGWIIARMSEEGSDIRNKRFINNARTLADRVLPVRRDVT